MADLNNNLTLRISLGLKDNPLGYVGNQSSPVIPNKKTETVDFLKVMLDSFLAGDSVNASMRCDVGPTAATGTFTTSSGNGTQTAIINGVSIAITWATSDTVSAALMAAAINASTNALVQGFVTATSALGVVTVTAVDVGLGGNAMTTTATGTGFTAGQARLTGGTNSYPAIAAHTASGTLTISSGSGVITAYIAGHATSVTWASSDSNTGDLLVAAIKADTQVNNMVTASNSSGTVTITTLSTGYWGNTISLSCAGTGATVTNTTAGYLKSGTDATTGYVEVTQAQASQTDTISGSDTGAYTVVINGITTTATGITDDTTTAAAIATAILANASLASLVTATSALGVVTVTALENSKWAGSAGNSVTFVCTGTGATAGNTTLLGGLDPITTRFSF